MSPSNGPQQRVCSFKEGKKQDKMILEMKRRRGRKGWLEEVPEGEVNLIEGASRRFGPFTPSIASFNLKGLLSLYTPYRPYN